MKAVFTILMLHIFFHTHAQDNAEHQVLMLYPTNDLSVTSCQGSGFVFRTASCYYLVTALHVLTKTPKQFEAYWPKSVLKNSYKFLRFGYASSHLKSVFHIPLLDSLTGDLLYETFGKGDSLLDLAILKLDTANHNLDFIFENASPFTNLDTSVNIGRDALLHAVGYCGSRSKLYNVSAINPRNHRSNPAIFKFYFENNQQILSGISGGPIYRSGIDFAQVPLGIFIAESDFGDFGLGIYLKYVHDIIKENELNEAVRISSSN